MNKDLEQVIVDYLSNDVNDEDRTARGIKTNLSTLPGLHNVTKKEINSTLYKSNLFKEYMKENDVRPYWMLVDLNVKIEKVDEILDRTYIFVDCDNSPDMFYYLVNKISRYGSVAVYGYSGVCYNTSRIDSRHFSSQFDPEALISFHQTDITSKGATCTVLYFDLFTLLQTNSSAICFLIGGDNTLPTVADELTRRFPESQIYTGMDSKEIRREIADYV